MSKNQLDDGTQAQVAVVRSPFSAAALTIEQMSILKTQIAPGITDGDLMYCLEIAKQAQLNPIIKEIYFVPRKQNIAEYGQPDQWVTKHDPMIGRRGARTIARRKGMTVPPTTGYTIKLFPYLDPEGEWQEKRDLVGWAELEIEGKKVRKEAAYSVYKQTTKKGEVTQFWKGMPTVMVEKVAEFQLLDAVYGLDGLMSVDAGFLDGENASLPIQSLKKDKAKVIDALSSLGIEYTINGDTITVQKAYAHSAVLKSTGFNHHDGVWKITVTESDMLDAEILPKPIEETPIAPKPTKPEKTSKKTSPKSDLMKLLLGNGITTEEAGRFVEKTFGDLSDLKKVEDIISPDNRETLMNQIKAFLNPTLPPKEEKPTQTALFEGIPPLDEDDEKNPFGE
ncbi:recombinase RecT [Sulfurospirillum multivorans]|uniref:RecT family domain-containing protein n=2 Tax=Sulfurospirillum multivorans TaxID=66821 RepID=A0AA86APA8_SULMK|nr:recombinase RecT [Sulfurospirillum multivorans]AHJ13091.1 RecT family domain-containing protein [Sulfurospirillum multivorans DSM 12446]